MKVGIVGTEQDPSEHTGEIIKVDRVNPTRHCNIVEVEIVTVDRSTPN